MVEYRPEPLKNYAQWVGEVLQQLHNLFCLFHFHFLQVTFKLFLPLLTGSIVRTEIYLKNAKRFVHLAGAKNIQQYV